MVNTMIISQESVEFSSPVDDFLDHKGRHKWNSQMVFPAVCRIWPRVLLQNYQSWFFSKSTKWRQPLLHFKTLIFPIIMVQDQFIVDSGASIEQQVTKW